MTAPTTTPELERALTRYGDDLYRLALLVCRDERAAARALPSAARRLAAGEARPDEPALIRALIAALPNDAKRRPARHLPDWAQPPASREELRPLLAAIARLPRPARLTLGLSILRNFEPAQVAVVMGGDEAGVRAQLRDALLALAPHAALERTPTVLSAADAPEACRPTRAALALADPQQLANPAVRSHLALCSACRAADLAWSQLATVVEEALRGALRDARLPAALAERMQAAARAPSDTLADRWYARPRVRIALVALPVLALIAVLVWPRGAPGAPTGSTATQSGATSAELAQRALAQLYTAPGGTGVWHAQYAIEWGFADNTHALLSADQWEDAARGRHRLQLVHHTGGGPYEFELAGDGQALWYAISSGYVSSLYPLSPSAEGQGVRFTLGAEQREQMRQARLESGAWDVAGAYLRQANAAELRTWGRQRDADGRLLRLISFAGVSPLALPPDAPNATASTVTVLLAIDEASGRLREVRELFGAAGAEQTARTTWRVVSEEVIDDAEQGNRVFDQNTAWNGTGSFTERGTLASALLPLVEQSELASPVELLQHGPADARMPAHTPPGATAAALIAPATGGGPAGGIVPNGLTFVYLGQGRRLFVNIAEPGQQSFVPERPERLTLDGNAVFLQPLAAQSYRALILRPSVGQSVRFSTQLAAVGYTRADLLALIQSLGVPTPAALHEQAALFIEQRPHDAAWHALIGALADAPAPPADGARYFTEHVFKRELRRPDQLADPYHRPPYGGWPEQLVHENWARTIADGTRESGALTRDPAGRLLARQYRGATQSWDYDALAERVSQFRYPSPFFGALLNEDQSTVLRMLSCPGATLRDGPGARSVLLAEAGWREQACMQPQYPDLWRQQQADAGYLTDAGPYLGDLADDTITTVIILGADGRPARTQVWAGQPDTGVLLESWERVGEDALPPERVPADAFSQQPPAALTRVRYGPDFGPVVGEVDIGIHVATLTDTLKIARSPLLGFAPGLGQPALMSLELGRESENSVSPVYFDGDSDGVFKRMLAEGYAVRSVYSVNTSRGLQLLRMYQGAATQAAAYLRAQAAWMRSTPKTLQIAEKSVDAWEVIERGTNTAWLLFEVDGTLIAVQSPTDDILPVVAQLVALGP